MAWIIALVHGCQHLGQNVTTKAETVTLRQEWLWHGCMFPGTQWFSSKQEDPCRWDVLGANASRQYRLAAPACTMLRLCELLQLMFVTSVCDHGQITDHLLVLVTSCQACCHHRLAHVKSQAMANLLLVVYAEP